MLTIDQLDPFLPLAPSLARCACLFSPALIRRFSLSLLSLSAGIKDSSSEAAINMNGIKIQTIYQTVIWHRICTHLALIFSVLRDHGARRTFFPSLFFLIPPPRPASHFLCILSIRITAIRLCCSHGRRRFFLRFAGDRAHDFPVARRRPPPPASRSRRRPSSSRDSRPITSSCRLPAPPYSLRISVGKLTGSLTLRGSVDCGKR